MPAKETKTRGHPDLKDKTISVRKSSSYYETPSNIQDRIGFNRNKWFGNVEQALLLLSKREIAKKARYGFCRCEEPVKYVSQIQDRYDHYVQIVPMR